MSVPHSETIERTSWVLRAAMIYTPLLRSGEADVVNRVSEISEKRIEWLGSAVAPKWPIGVPLFGQSNDDGVKRSFVSVGIVCLVYAVHLKNDDRAILVVFIDRSGLNLHTTPKGCFDIINRSLTSSRTSDSLCSFEASNSIRKD